MPTQQLTEVKETYFNPITSKQETDSFLYISDVRLHCGDVVEILMPKPDDEETGYWKAARIEKGLEGNYYAVGLPFHSVNGLIARTIQED